MTAPRIPRRSAYIPAGCDHQGRHERTGCFVQATEAANDIGTDDPPDFTAQANRHLAFWLAVAAALAGAVYLVLWGRA